MSARTLFQLMERRPLPWLCLLAVAILVPFLDKAVHIDDTLFVYAARQILEAPTDFYGFDINWYGVPAPAHEINQNPPLVSYYIALVLAVAGENRIVIHLAMLVPMVLSVMGVYRLAERLNLPAVPVALGMLFTPVFLVSSTTLMSDVAMLAFWLWALNLWIDGLRRGNTVKLALAAVCASLCGLSKYFGLAVIGLMGISAMGIRRKLDHRWWLLLLPVAVMGAYHFYTLRIYGHSLFGDAAEYAAEQRVKESGYVWRGFHTLFYTGGCLGVWPLGIVLVKSVRNATVTVACAIGVALFVFLAGIARMLPLKPWQEFDGLWVIHLALFSCCGAVVLAMLVAMLRKEVSCVTILLASWVGGTLVFAGLINWTLNGRSMLPLAPSVALLGAWVARRYPRFVGFSPSAHAKVAVAALALSWTVAFCDFEVARADDVAAQRILDNHDPGTHAMVFQGHWGFQYSMERGGAIAFNGNEPVYMPGDLLVIPLNNINTFQISHEHVETLEEFEVALRSPGTTMDRTVGADFYASVKGPLPFVLGDNAPNKYVVLRVRDPVNN